MDRRACGRPSPSTCSQRSSRPTTLLKRPSCNSRGGEGAAAACAPVRQAGRLALLGWSSVIPGLGDGRAGRRCTYFGGPSPRCDLRLELRAASRTVRHRTQRPCPAPFGSIGWPARHLRMAALLGLRQLLGHHRSRWPATTGVLGDSCRVCRCTVGCWSFLGRGWKENWRWVRILIGTTRTPSAWDHLFQDQPAGWVLCKLNSGIWVGGVYGQVDGHPAYASGYPEAPDLYLPAMIEVDPDTGEIATNGDGLPVRLGLGVLLKWDNIELLEFIRQPEDPDGK